MSTIKINGNPYAGKSITVRNGAVIIDGQDVTPNGKDIRIEIHGNVGNCTVDACSNISIVGDVSGNVNSISGNIQCGHVSGSVGTVGGNVYVKSVGGKATSIGGNISIG